MWNPQSEAVFFPCGAVAKSGRLSLKSILASLADIDDFFLPLEHDSLGTATPTLYGYATRCVYIYIHRGVVRQAQRGHFAYTWVPASGVFRVTVATIGAEEEYQSIQDHDIEVVQICLLGELSASYCC